MARHLVRNARVQRRGDSGVEAVPDGTHVYLDYPGGPMQFRHFVVQGGRLRLADQRDHQVVHEASYAHFGVWSEDELDVAVYPDAAPYAPVEGFGFPLPARFVGNRIILPGTRTLRLRIVDASGSPSGPATIERHVTQARRYFEKLHITVEDHREVLDLPEDWGLILDRVGENFDRDRFAATLARDDTFTQAAGEDEPAEIATAIDFVRQRPSFHRLVWNTPRAAPLAIDTTFGWNRLQRVVLERLQAYGLSGTPPTRDPLSSFQREPWAPPRAERRNTIVVIYVEKCRGMAATAGVAWPFVSAFDGIVENGQLWDHAPCPYVFLATDPVETAQNVIQPLTHEIAHCLLGDAGMSHRRLDLYEDEYQSRTKTQQLLGGLGIETATDPGRVLYDRLVRPRVMTTHVRSSTPRNLMQEGGGTALLPWQVAVMRASPTIGDGPTRTQANRARQAPELTTETAGG